MLPWFTVDMALPETGEGLLSGVYDGVVGYRDGGDRRVISGMAVLIIGLGVWWTWQPERLLLRPTLATLLGATVFWATLPIVEAGSLPASSATTATLSASVGPYVVVLVALLGGVGVACARPDLRDVPRLRKAAAAAYERGRGSKAVEWGRRILRAHATTPRGDREAMRAAFDLAVYLYGAGFNTDADTVLKRLRSQSGLAADVELSRSVSELARLLSRDEGRDQ